MPDTTTTEVATKKEKKKFKPTFFKEFKAFLNRGNILDLAIAVIIGTAFSAIVTSLANDIIMPLITLAMGGDGIAGAALVLNGVPADDPTAIFWRYGNFIQAIINFLIIALCIFTAMRLMMRAKKASAKAYVKTKETIDIEKKMRTGVNPLLAKIMDEQALQEAEKAAAAAEASKTAAEDEKPDPAFESQEDILREIRDLLKVLSTKD